MEQRQKSGQVVEVESKLGQLITVDAAGGEANEVSASWLTAVGLHDGAEVGQRVALVAVVDGQRSEVDCLVVDKQDEMGAGGLWLEVATSESAARRPWKQPVVSEHGISWGAEEVDPLRTAEASACDLWWDQQAESALVDCLEGEDLHRGGLFESVEAAPDERVLGSWCFGRLRAAVGGLKPAAVCEQLCDSNPQWARDKAKAQVFQAGSLMQHRDKFEEFGADAQVLQWLDQGGYEVRLSERLLKEGAAEGRQAVGIEKRNGGTASENEADLSLIVLEAVLKGSYEVVKDRSEVDNVLPANLAPKPSKVPPWRLISNAIAVNEFLELWSVRYETLKTVPLVVQQNDWIFSIDLTDAYHQFLLVEQSRRLFGHSVIVTAEQLRQLEEAGMLPEGFVRTDAGDGMFVLIIRPVGLPMGFKNACAVWTKIARVLTAKWRREGKKLVHLLDDFMFAVPGECSFEEACAVRDAVLADLEAIGAQVNWKKSILTPSKCLRFLGMLVETVSYRFYVPEDKIKKLNALVEKVVQQAEDGGAPEATFRELAKVLGKILSMRIAVPAVSMMTHECFKLLRPEGEWDNSVKLTREVVEELMGVMEWIVKYNQQGNPIRRFTGMEELVLTVDAGTGYGWRLDGRSRSEAPTESSRLEAREWVGEEGELHQCWKELLALRRALQEEAAALRGRFVLVRADATTTLRYVNKGKGSSVFLSSLMKEIWDLCVEFEVSLVAEHIAGERMVATGVDSMSRASEFSVNKKLFRWLSKEAGFGAAPGYNGYTLDLYASKKTAKCTRFCSRATDDGSVGDARTFKLSAEENVWACPPLCMLPVAVMMLVESGVRATVVVPEWPNQPWFGLLREHAVDVRYLKWHQNSCVMFDVADRKNLHVHAVDKWDFVAFALGGAGEAGALAGWKVRRKKSEKRPRRHATPELRRVKKRKQGLCVEDLTSFRPVRLLSVCHGIGVSTLVLQRVGLPLEVRAVECDADCRKLTTVRFPEEDQSVAPIEELLRCPVKDLQQVDLLVGGFPCQDVSSANKQGRGLDGAKSSLFFDVLELVRRLRLDNGDFILECTDFSGNHAEHFRLVG